MKVGIVYLITNVANDKKYVGITTMSLKKRWKEHLRDSKKYDYPLYRAIRKYGISTFSISVLHTVSASTKQEIIFILNELEIKYISEYKTFVGWNMGGYNLTIGGGVQNISVESRKKQGRSMRMWYKNNPEFVKCRGERIRQLHMNDSSYGKNIANKLRRLYRSNPSLRKSISEKMSGKNHHSFDNTIYTFQNNVTGEMFVGTRFDFTKTHSLLKSKVCLLIQGKRKSHNNWKLI